MASGNIAKVISFLEEAADMLKETPKREEAQQPGQATSRLSGTSSPISPVQRLASFAENMYAIVSVRIDTPVCVAMVCAIWK